MNDVEKNKQKMNYIQSIVLYLGFMVIISSIVASIYLEIAKPVERDSNSYILFSTLLNLFIYLSLTTIYIVLNRKVLKEDAKQLKNKWWLKLLFIVAGYVAMIFGSLLAQFINDLFQIKTGSSNQESIETMTKKYALLMIVSAGLLGPFVEELVFRKSIFGLFNGNCLPLFISSIAFGLFHVISAMDIIQILPYLATGFILGGLYILTKKNIYITYGAHALSNIIALTIIIFS